MIHAVVLTFWDGRNLDIDRFLIRDGDCANDISETPSGNIPTTPNLVVVSCTIADDTYDDIYADSDYGIGAILYSEEV